VALASCVIIENEAAISHVNVVAVRLRLVEIIPDGSFTNT
jgi:hypothetical protein